MKAKDLKTDGTQYYYTISDTWLRWNHEGNPATVVDARPGTWHRDREGQWHHRPGGQDVLVDVQHSPDYPPTRRAVRTQTLRGPYSECVELIRKTRQDRYEAERDRRDQMNRVALPGRTAASLLNELGIRAESRENEAKLYAEVWVPHGHTAALLAAVQHLVNTGWTPPAK